MIRRGVYQQRRADTADAAEGQRSRGFPDHSDWTCTALPASARNALADALKIGGTKPPGTCAERTHALDDAITRVRLMYPRFFIQEAT